MIRIIEPLAATAGMAAAAGIAISESTPVTLGIVATCTASIVLAAVWHGRQVQKLQEAEKKLDAIIARLDRGSSEMQRFDHRLTHLEAGCMARHPAQQPHALTQRIET